jgi:Protein of unknown function (DUF3223)
MPRSRPLTLGGKRFGTQKAANLFIKELLNREPLKVAVPEPHHSFLWDLLSRHPHAAEKIAGGIGHFTVEHALHGTRCFYLTRVDGTRTDFSYLKCTRGSE